MKEANGHYMKEDVAQIKSDVREMKDDLSSTLLILKDSIDKHSQSLERHGIVISDNTSKLDSIINFSLQAIPLPYVLTLMRWTFGILVLALVGVKGADLVLTRYFGGP